MRELDDVPEKFLDENVVQLDRAGFWDWLTKRYQKVFTEYPEFDGLMLTFYESQYKIFADTEVESKLSKPDRFTKMINTINQVCAKFKNDFIVRTFVYEPIELQWLKEGLEKTDSRVMIQSKCEPHGWNPYYPHEPLIGAFPKRHKSLNLTVPQSSLARIAFPIPVLNILHIAGVMSWHSPALQAITHM